MIIRCAISHNPESYDIEIKAGSLESPEKLVQHLRALGSKFAIITHDKIASLYGSSLHKLLSLSGLETYLFSFPSGEENKTRATKERLENQLLEKNFGRDTCLIALGGGVVTDMTGYLAATYCRGVSLVMIPTSLLAMVDASIGGKTGVNTSHGKNLIGCIYQPKKVWIDPTTLHSLPRRELVNGIVEMIKHGLIADVNFFEYLEQQTDRLLLLDSEILEQAIWTSCRIKKEIVEQDPKEAGKRRLLNCGHTIGHALEKLTNYSLPHGEAVAIGILLESHVAMQLGHLAPKAFDRIRKILEKYALPLQIPHSITLQDLLQTMALDKKSHQGKCRFVVISDIGSALSFKGDYCTYVEESLIKNALRSHHI